MDLSILLEEALAERGNVVMLIARPRDGENAVIQTSNVPFARILGWPADRLGGLRLVELRSFIERPEDWTILIAAVQSLSALTLDLRLRVRRREVWLGFNLTFRSDAAGGEGYGILIGRDITEARERSLRESELQRLLASVFLRIGAAVAIIDSDSAILMANPACQRLLGYGKGEMVGKHVEDMIAPESAAAVRAARAGQAGGAGDYVLRMAVLAKGGARVPVTLHSTLLRDARDRQLRVATLIPDPAPPRPQLAEMPADMPADAGQMRTLSLAALKADYGKEWKLIADHAMLLAEQVLKRYLGAADIMRRRDDDSYLIWFDGTNETRIAAALSAATREIRQRVLDNADDLAADLVGTAPIGAEAVPVVALARPAISPVGTESELLDGDCPLAERDAEALLQYLRAGAGAVADVEIVTGRDGVERPIVLVDFESAVRSRLYRLASSLAFEPVLGTGFDLTRLDLAAEALAEQGAHTKILTPVSWQALADPDCRPAFDRRLAQIAQSARSRIILTVSGVPRLLSKQRWSNAVDGLRRQLGDIGLSLTHRDGELAAIEDAITNEWPLSLLVVDRTEGPPVLIEEYRNLFAAARRREISILVRTTARNDIRDWRKLGATMFATAA